MANPLAYITSVLITTVKKFYSTGPWGLYYKLFTAIIFAISQ
jgi:hypothetical protein